jgi:hypothetical protein
MISKGRPLKKTADVSVTLAQPNAKRSRRQPGSAPLGCLLPTFQFSTRYLPTGLRFFLFSPSHFQTF